MENLSGQIRRIVAGCGVSRYAICKEAGIDQGMLSRFMACKAGLSMETLDALGQVLKLGVVAKGKPKRIPKGKPGRKRKAR